MKPGFQSSPQSVGGVGFCGDFAGYLRIFQAIRFPLCALRGGFVGFGAGPESGSGQIFAMSQLTANATTQPKITSLTLRRPVSAPTIFECVDRLPAMTTAAVIGACRHMTGIRTTYDASSTAIASVNGSFHAVGSPTDRK